MIPEELDLAVGFLLGVSATLAFCGLVAVAMVLGGTRRRAPELPRRPTQWDGIAEALRDEGDGIDWSAEAIEEDYQQRRRA